MNVPTCGKNILDLLFCSHPYLITNVEVVPGISDYEAILYSLNINSKPLSDEIKHPIFLYHRGDIDSLKSDILAFQTRFLTADPYSNSVEENWQIFTNAISRTTYINSYSTKWSKSANNLPWLTHTIKKQMNLRTRLYKRAKLLQTEEAWSNYHSIRNKITNTIREAQLNIKAICSLVMEK